MLFRKGKPTISLDEFRQIAFRLTPSVKAMGFALSLTTGLAWEPLASGEGPHPCDVPEGKADRAQGLGHLRRKLARFRTCRLPASPVPQHR